MSKDSSDMALQVCPTCGKSVDAQARICPACGHFIPGHKCQFDPNKECGSCHDHGGHAAAHVAHQQAAPAPGRSRIGTERIVIGALVVVVLVLVVLLIQSGAF